MAGDGHVTHPDLGPLEVEITETGTGTSLSQVGLEAAGDLEQGAAHRLLSPGNSQILLCFSPGRSLHSRVNREYM